MDSDNYSLCSSQSSDYADDNRICTPPIRREENCLRCRKRVYPTERVDFGLPMHKTCFRCAVCDVTLSQNSFVLTRPEEHANQGVYCKNHAPRAVSYALDDQSVEIRGAVLAQRLGKTPSFNKQIRLADSAGWEYDPKAMEFEHAKVLHLRNKLKRGPTGEGRLGQDDLVEEDDILEKLQENQNNSMVRDLATSMTTGLRFSETDSSDLHRSHLPLPSERRSGQAMLRFTSRENKNMHGDEMMTSSGASHKRRTHDWSNGAKLTPGRVPRESDDVIYECLNAPRNPNEPPKPPPRDTAPPLPQSVPPPLSAGLVPAHAYPEMLYAYPGFEHRPNYHDFYRGDGMYRSMVGMPPMVPFQDPRGVPQPCYENIPYLLQSMQNMAPRLDQSINKDYLTTQSFIAQNELELRQRQEHSEMMRDVTRMREQQVLYIENDIKEKMERAMQELLYKIEKGIFVGDLQAEKQRIDESFKKIKEEKIKGALDTLNLQERMRIDDIVEKQAREMLQLLDKKRTLADATAEELLDGYQQHQPVQVPAAEPPTKKKAQLYAGPQFFDEVDFQAIQVAQREQESFTELVYELTKSCGSQLEKTRAIFRWITVKDLNKMMFSEDLTEESPFYYLKAIKYGLESYHELFKRLCSYAGLTVKIVQGISKSAGYRPGMAIIDTNFRNSWTCVHIDGSWRFVDCHWGARHVTDSRDLEYVGSFQYELDEFFFLTDPDDHIYMHFPDESTWQLISRPISKEEFIRLPVVKSSFFHYGLTFAVQLLAVIESDSGAVEIVLQTNNKIPMAFNTRLEAENDILDGYCIHHLSGLEAIFNLCLPEVGTYYFTIFACDVDKAETYNNICAFKIKCSHVKNKPFCKFPRLPHGYGPTHLSKELGMTTEKYSEPYLVCNDGKMILNIRFKESVKVSHKLMSSRFEEYSESLNRLVFQRYRDNNFVSFLIRFPERGIYLFSLFAAQEGSDKPVLECAYRYLIQCNVNPAGPVRMYPKIQQSWTRCRLYEPTLGELKIEKNTRFKLEVSDADAVAVIIGTQWNYLKRDEDGKVWEGVVHTGKVAGTAAEVYARYSHNARDFFPLLEYNLVEGD